jgi:hypothetical protein
VAIVSELKKMWLTFSPPECVPLKIAFDRIMSFAGATDLAALYLKGYCRNRRLRAMVLYLSADKQHMVTHLNPSNCDEHVQALAGDDSSKPNGYCFVPLVDLDNLSAATPTMTAAPQSDDTRPPERRREQAVPKRPKRRKTSKQKVLEAILRSSYPEGVSADMSPAAVTQKVDAAWKAECQAQRIELTQSPGWDTIARKLGRRRD